jgi:c(7)-type cytochrome triheme protein
MSYPASQLTAFLLLLIVSLAGVESAVASKYALPPMPEPHRYGTLVLDRLASAKGAKPVVFAHWSHRTRASCAICHSELDFAMKAGETEITEAENQAGRYCGACHNGTIAFGLTDNCQRCHSEDRDAEKERFVAFRRSKTFEETPFGNRIDWVLALRRGQIEPARFYKDEYEEMPFDKELSLQAEMQRIPPAIFPHKAHTDWMDCNLCHPAIFNIKAKTTAHFRMNFILKGEFCGACHLSVAFPLDDCARCHPGMKE